MALAFYRKYRPKNLDDIVGQSSVTDVLKSAAAKNAFAHAYLFHGPRGSGKTTTARLVAKLLNCEKRWADKKFVAEAEPCNVCRRCREIDLGRALDVVEIDAASHRGIDEIRSIKEGVALSPASYPYKVFIIDEAHQLTKDAFNALLKTLEEPPAHAVLILATTEYEKVPATIISRTQKFHFRKLPIEEIKKKLLSIAAAEKIMISDDALELIAASAEGSLRDAESLLDQVAARSGAIALADVEAIIGKTGLRRVGDCAEMLLEKKLDAALAFIEKISEEGYNVVDFTKELIHYLRKVITIKLDPKLAPVFETQMTDRDFNRAKAQAAKADVELTLHLLKTFIRAWSEMRYAPFASVPLEVAIIECLRDNEK